MPEEEAIKYVVLHLAAPTYEWWHHDMVFMGYEQITSQVKFIKRLIERFDKKDPKLHLKELTQLK